MPERKVRGVRGGSPKTGLRLAPVILWIAAACCPVFAQEPPARETAKPLATIEPLLESIRDSEEDLTRLRAELAGLEIPEEQQAKTLEIAELTVRLEQLRRDLESVATGIDRAAESEAASDEVDLGKEIRELLGPIVRELKKATAKPRETEKLRSTVDHLDALTKQARRAVANLEALIAGVEDEATRATLEALHETWKQILEDRSNELLVAKYQLGERLRSEETVVGTLREGFAGFFRTRGKNALIALGAGISTFFVLRVLHRLVHRYSPLRRRGQRSFFLRLADVLYYLLTVTLAIAAALLALYVLSDWMLLGLTALTVAGLVWASKQSLTHFYDQMKLMLNLGAVREGERVVYLGVPWEVRSISLYSDLRNQRLRGGHLRLPLRELHRLVSREADPQEFLFPCEEGDWLLLADGTYGKVVLQTPEWVQLIALGGSRKNVPTPEFLKLAPQNLSCGFRLQVRFGIDYRHQGTATSEIPDRMESKISKGLARLLKPEQMVHLGVEFQEAAGSALIYLIIGDFRGEAASRYQFLQRAMQRLAVEACNEHGWVIPFLQVTLHQGDAPEGSAESVRELTPPEWAARSRDAACGQGSPPPAPPPASAR